MSKDVNHVANQPPADPMESRLFVVRVPLPGPDGEPTGEYHYVLTERVADLHPGRVEPGTTEEIQGIARSLAALFAAGPLFEAIAITSTHDTDSGPETLFASIAGGNASAD
jgi:hypothetical protein